MISFHLKMFELEIVFANYFILGFLAFFICDQFLILYMQLFFLNASIILFLYRFQSPSAYSSHVGSSLRGLLLPALFLLGPAHPPSANMQLATFPYAIYPERFLSFTKLNLSLIVSGLPILQCLLRCSLVYSKVSKMGKTCVTFNFKFQTYRAQPGGFLPHGQLRRHNRW